jgi:regulator of protease activity HflC (stomatin/prohibitin superfamily)
VIQALVDLIVRIWWSLIPIAVVQYDERGLRARRGRSGPDQVLEPGWHWRWWIIESVELVPATWDYIDLSFGDMPTGDGKLVTFSANVEYRITDPWQLRSTMSDPDANLSRLALGKLSELVTEDEDGAMAQGQKATRTWMRKKLQTECNGRGIEIGKVLITTWVERPRVIRLLSDGPVIG